MLLKFSAENFKTFKDKFVFSMEAAPKQKGLDDSVFKKRIASKCYKGLCTAVIYGPNAAGKTNLMQALSVFKAIILRGNIKSAPQMTTDWPDLRLELLPNCTLEKAKPVSFGIKFIVEGLVIEYSLSLDLGHFCGDDDYERKILSEVLKVNEKEIFVRTDSLEIKNLRTIESLLNDEALDGTKLVILTSLAQRGLESTDLFLVNGFKVIFSKKLVQKIKDWLLEQLIVISRPDLFEFNSIYAKAYGFNAIDVFTMLAQKMGTDAQRLGYVFKGPRKEVLTSAVKVGNKEQEYFVSSELYESRGALRTMNLFPLFLSALQNGSTVLIDELESCIHPMVMMNIIKILHNDEININHAQLIFNTHNPIFLNANLLRRDEIKFVERDNETHFSRHYSLADFKTLGANGVRKGEDYLKNYYAGSYGAIDEVDLSDLFDKVISKKEKFN